MLNHSKPVVRKRAVVALYKVFTMYPEVVSLGMPRLREKLEDPDPGNDPFTYLPGLEFTPESRCSYGHGERSVRIISPEPKGLSHTCSSIVPSSYHIIKQLDADQDHQTCKSY
jgi:hypothetical protein